MKSKNLLVITNSFPDKENKYVGNVFVKELVKYLKDYFKKVYVISPVAYGIEYLRKTHHEDYQFDNVHAYFPKYFNLPILYFYFRNLWVYLEKRAIIKLIQKKKIKFDLIHAHFTWPSGAVAVELKKEFKVPVVIREGTSVTFKKVIDKKDFQYIKAWKLCDAIIRVRKGDMHLFDSVGISRDKVHYIPNGYDGKKFVKSDKQICREKLYLPMDKKIILNIGNLYGEVKGHRYLIEAIYEVVKHRKDVLCIIVGSGKLKGKLEKQIKKAGLESYVKLAGGRPHDEIPIWMNACDVFVLPSLNEGNPNVMFEALGCGKPFVGTKVGGMPEVINSEDYGMLVEPANPKELAEKILIALDKEWDYEKILEYAEQFSIEIKVKEILEVYKQIL
jgi:glycosyltransferase involved in cell wall biosynthesis